MSEYNESTARILNVRELEEKETPVPRMRSMQECADYFATRDPETKIKYCTLRKWALEGKIQFVQIGNRKLINLDLLLDIASGKAPWPEQKNTLMLLPPRGKKR